MSHTAMLRSLLHVTIIPFWKKEKICIKFFTDKYFKRKFDEYLEVEAEMQDGLAVVDEGVDHLPRLHVPHPDCAVGGPGDNHLEAVKLSKLKTGFLSLPYHHTEDRELILCVPLTLSCIAEIENRVEMGARFKGPLDGK